MSVASQTKLLKYSSLVFVLAMLGACNRPPSQQAANNIPPAVSVAAVAERDVNSVYEQIGRTEAVRRVEIRARIKGVLKALQFMEGTEVKKGDLLFEIEPEQYEADLAVATASVANAQAAHRKAAHYLKRLKSMRSTAVSALDMENANSDELQTAAELAQAKAQWQLAKLDLDYTQIRAPISGRIGKANVTEGNLITTENDVLATIVQLDPMYVTWSISERIFSLIMQEHIKQKQPLDVPRGVIPTIRLSNDVVYAHQGEPVFIDNEINTRTGSIATRARFPNPDKELVPGQFVTILVRIEKPQRKKLVPQSAVQQDQAGYFVLIVDDNKQVSQRRVKVGSRFGTEWAINEGLQRGELVIYQGVEKVRPGVEVSPTLMQEEAPSESTEQKGN
ncbi:MAG: efflux RND transporter periplasmic adaptor subunit [Pseudomonadales bacterium]